MGSFDCRGTRSSGGFEMIQSSSSREGSEPGMAFFSCGGSAPNLTCGVGVPTNPDRVSGSPLVPVERALITAASRATLHPITIDADTQAMRKRTAVGHDFN